MHELAFPLLVGLVILALAFDFLNGLHDAANSIATVVATRLLRPVQAVLFAAFFNFAAYFLSIIFPELHKVAETIGKGIIDKDLVTPAVVFGALVGAMFWNVVTWLKGIPSSSSHALVGGIVGAGVAHARFEGIEWTGLNKTVNAIFLSPHKFIGGPGASGVLIVRRDAVLDTTPTWPGGGTVKFVSPVGHDYSGSLEARDEAGTPNVVGAIGAPLVTNGAPDAKERTWTSTRRRASSSWRTARRPRPG